MRRFYLSKLAILVTILLGWTLNVQSQTVTYYYTGAMQTYKVPVYSTQVTFDAVGAVGGWSSTGQRGGYGGRVQGTLTVTPGQILYLFVGGAGIDGVVGTSQPGGFNDSGANGGWCTSISGYGGGGGGGGTDIRVGGTSLLNRLVVAGGGGGGACNCTNPGGNGGGLIGGNASNCSTEYCGVGGSQVAGGAGGTYSPYGTSSPGVLGWGGIASTSPYQSPGSAGGGGGGGYYGGGGGSWGGGGGGSSYTDPVLVTGAAHTQGYLTSKDSGGHIVFTPNCVPATSGGIISGPSLLCGGSGSVTLSETLPGGVWSSANTAIATIGSATGVVNGITSGTAVISYGVSYPCGSPAYATYVMTVSPGPNPIAGSTNICTGVPTTFTDAGGGTWSSGNTTLVTIGSATGIANGLNIGNAVITYTLPTGCYGTVTTTVNVSPSLYSVTGGGAFCAGGTGQDIFMGGSDMLVNYKLYDGGTLVSTQSGTSTYIDFGFQTTAGTYTVVATNTNGGCTRNMTGNPIITVNPVPPVHGVINGGSYCIGGSGVHVGLNGSNAGTSYQLFLGTGAYGAPVAGLGGTVDFGLITAIGTYTAQAFYPATGCSTNMTGSATITENPLPPTHNVTGGGSYCTGGIGVPVGLDGSDTGITYELYNTGMPAGSMAGTGLPLNFGLQTASGSYSIIATNNHTGCTQNMSAVATVNIDALPTVYPLGGGGSYCQGGAGSSIYLGYSLVGVNYQLFRGVTPLSGHLLTGIGDTLFFGNFTAAGTYHVVATNATSGCTSNMSGAPVITVNSLPVSVMVSGGGHYCSTGAGRDITLSPATTGIQYQLYNGIAPAGFPISAVGSTVDFGYQTSSGNYMVVATDPTTGCTNNMADTQTIIIDPLPNPYVVEGGGNYCAGGAGVPVNLSLSDSFVHYQLYLGTVVSGSSMAGTGSLLNFGNEGAPGNYTIKATSDLTGCSVWMSGEVTVNINPVPLVYPVTGGGVFCSNGVGVRVALSYGNYGINYQLYKNDTAYGTPVSGSGVSLDFGLQTAPGVYTVIGTNTSTGCQVNMSGSATVTTTPAPVVYTVSGGGSFCSGGAGEHVSLTASNYGVSYQLYNGGIPSGSSVSGSGAVLDFGLRTDPGTYKVVATNTSNSCVSNMNDSATIIVNLTPSVYTVTGGGAYCIGTGGVLIGLSSSDPLVDYTLYMGGVPAASAVSGTGSVISFGYETSSGTYTVNAVNPTTGCVATMSGLATVTADPLPNVYNVTGGGNFCAGGNGVHVGLSNSSIDVNYQLMNGSVPVGVAIPGTNAALDFGLQTSPGTYTVMATNTFSPCSAYMSGSVVIVVNPNPTIDTVTGGGSYCAGGTGVHVGLNSSDLGVNYKLYNGSTMVGIAWIGTSGSMDFGAQTAAGTYTVVAVNPTTSCKSNMYGSAGITVTPVVHDGITIEASKPSPICAGTVDSFYNINYSGGLTPTMQWSVNGLNVGVGDSFVYAPVNGDMVTVTMTSSIPCAIPATVSSSMNMVVIPNVTPSATISANTGDSVCLGSNSVYTIFPVNGGGSPAYHWYKNGAMVASGNTFTYAPVSGDIVYAELVSSITCVTADSAASDSLTMVTITPMVPSVTISSSPAIAVLEENDTLIAHVINGGPTPTFVWFVNGVRVATGPVFISNQLNNNDSVSCQVMSSGKCGGLPGSSYEIMHVENLAVQSVATGGNFTVSPNPSKGTFLVKGSFGSITGDEEVTLEMTNMLGQVVYSGKVMTHNGNISTQVNTGSSVANGMYLLTLRSASENTVIHLVIEQ